jgi:hypothetical protein
MRVIVVSKSETRLTRDNSLHHISQTSQEAPCKNYPLSVNQPDYVNQGFSTRKQGVPAVE